MAVVTSTWLLLFPALFCSSSSYFVKGKVTQKGPSHTLGKRSYFIQSGSYPRMGKRSFYSGGGYPLMGRRSSPSQADMGSVDLPQGAPVFKQESALSGLLHPYPRDTNQQPASDVELINRSDEVMSGPYVTGESGEPLQALEKSYLSRLFQVFDVDGDSRLSQTEFIDAVEKIKGRDHVC